MLVLTCATVRLLPHPQGLPLARASRQAFQRHGTPLLSRSEEADAIKEDLFAFIPKQRWGAPATNLTVDAPAVLLISELVSQLEPLSPFSGVLFAESAEAQAALSGDWQLVYSDASEITRLNSLPLGFRLGRVFQCIDTAGGRFENQAFVKHALSLASAHTRVVAQFWLPPQGEVNRVGVPNAGNRANVKFERVVFSLRRLLLLRFFGLVKKVAKPNGPSEQVGVVPSIDVTYLDEELRVSRGGDGSLFVLRRLGRGEPGPLAMMGGSAGEMRLTEKKTYNAATDLLPSGAIAEEEA